MKLGVALILVGLGATLYGRCPPRDAPAPVPSARRAPGPGRPVGLAAPRRPAVVAAPIIAVAAPIDTALLSGNKQVILIEQGQMGKANAQ